MVWPWRTLLQEVLAIIAPVAGMGCFLNNKIIFVEAESYQIKTLVRGENDGQNLPYWRAPRFDWFLVLIWLVCVSIFWAILQTHLVRWLTAVCCRSNLVGPQSMATLPFRNGLCKRLLWHLLNKCGLKVNFYIGKVVFRRLLAIIYINLGLWL